MAGPAHDVLVQALRDDASLLPAILSRLRGVHLPPLLEPLDSAVRLARPVEVRPDLLHRTADGWLVCEVQLKIDWSKRRRWLLLVSVLHDETQRMGDLVILTVSAAVARWARRVAHVRGKAGTRLTLTPVVVHLGMRAARALLDPATPQLALCAAWAMQRRHGPAAARIVEQAIDITTHLPPPLRDAQWRAILDVLSDKMLSHLREVTMHPERYPERPAVRKLRLFLEGQGRAEGKAEGRAEGKAEGRAEGKAEGRAEGKAESKREDLLLILSERGLPLTSDERAGIEKCEDVEQLALWLRRAVTAASVADVLAAAVKTTKPRPRSRRPRSTAGSASR
jgi:hypothetical protein